MDWGTVDRATPLAIFRLRTGPTLGGYVAGPRSISPHAFQKDEVRAKASWARRQEDRGLITGLPGRTLTLHALCICGARQKRAARNERPKSREETPKVGYDMPGNPRCRDAGYELFTLHGNCVGTFSDAFRKVCDFAATISLFSRQLCTAIRE